MEANVTGKYRHFKGGEYEVLGIGKHSETQEDFVIYKALYGEGGLWVRPKDMFFGEKEVDGKMVPRFAKL
jgi:cyclomaltodextrinase / maltogenic alpha-amylase / neopullulanase